ncbi:monovalent cation/H+ antiporter complex subunit F [Algisphaera agarilytica]|uniref:Multicomponent Na+:H+ antiporter subunit F n=1 Tax=Algisphaera agarilytica TaxID=1385975 RepID=A0A7X0LIQ2_9BACT|nr:monovalent cation/H+ antiporter complex subunit F [Algisphaera agarilytica]MBB6428445.1 multicomponent Na+:H+ antiporter subunit F [Algisphaera agarilytica]
MSGIDLADYPWAVGVVHVLLSVLGLSMVCAAIRLLRGPSLPDRVVALDLLVVAAVAVVALLAWVYRQPSLIDLAVLLALTAFISTVALAWYVERSKR